MDKDQVKLRKYEHILAVSGVGVIAFGLWSIVKASVYVILSPVSQFSELIPKEELEQLEEIGVGERTTDITIIVMLMFALTLDVLVRIYVGRCAIAEGRELKKKRFIYVILAAIMALGLVSAPIHEVMGLLGSEVPEQADVMNAMSVSWIVDITSMLALIELVVAAIMVRRLRKGKG